MPTIAQARSWYVSDPVHGFDHVLRVLHLVQRFGRILGADLELLEAAALLHDARGSAPDSNQRDAHHLLSAEFAGEVLAAEGWAPPRIQAVQLCIRAHRFRSRGEEPATLEARILFDADKLDVLGAVGAGRTLAYAVQAGQPLYAPPSARFLASGEHEPGEAHSAYHEYLFKLRHIPSRLYTAPARQLATQRAAYLEAFFQRMIAESAGEA